MQNSELGQNKIDFLQELLRSYTPRQEVIDWCRSITLGVVIGPAGSGKDTLRNELITRNSDSFSLLLSDTSRSMRINEVDGVEYHFRTLENMIEGFYRGDYLQGAIVHGQQLSGLNAQELLALPENVMPLGILIIQTVEELVKKQLKIRGVFLVPPSLDEMKDRLSERQGISAEEQNRRFKTAKVELELALKHEDYQFIVTRNIEKSVEISKKFLLKGEIDMIEQVSAKQAATDLLRSL